MAANSRSLFSADLAQLKVTLRQLGECAIEMLEGATEALVNQDYDLAEQVRKRDNLADALDEKVDEDCVTLLALQAPVARDLRIIMGSARIATDLERIADYAKDIAKVARKLSSEDYFWPLEDIPSMAHSCAAMGRMSLAALDDVDEDIDLGARMLVDAVARSEVDDIGVEIALGDVDRPHRATRRLDLDVVGVHEDAGQRRARESGDLDAIVARLLPQVLPAVTAGVLALELLAQVPWIVVVREDEGLADGELAVSGMNARVPLRLRDPPHVHHLWGRGHRARLSVGSGFHQSFLYKLRV